MEPFQLYPHHNLHNSMMNFVSNSIEDADVIIYMVDCNEVELKNSDFSRVVMVGSDLTDVDLSNSDLSKGIFNESNFK